MKKFRVVVYRVTRIEKCTTFRVTSKSAEDAYDMASMIAAETSDSKWRTVCVNDYEDEFSIREMY